MLADVKFDQTVIACRGGELRLRGLAPADLTALMEQEPDALSRVQSIASAVLVDNQVSAWKLAAAAYALLPIAPPLIAKVIAHAAGEPDQWEKALRLPISVQVDALITTAKLTLGDSITGRLVSGVSS